MTRPIVLLGIIVGAAFVFLGIFYLITPANALPSFLPGYSSTLVKIHYKHGIGALLLGLAAFAFAWFQSGKKSPRK
ncbi:hypothetical protein HY024_04555 [Candidatus Curtissbacteria bacterium]|nr:hypothetical protein [Candidatus Curtissbacteria bacterium]